VAIRAFRRRAILMAAVETYQSRWKPRWTRRCHAGRACIIIPVRMATAAPVEGRPHAHDH
jgi:hypothetical protein